MRVLGGWADDPLWASVYDWMVEHPVAGGAAFRAGLGSPLRLLHEATYELGDLPAGARVLDVPCGGGVALRGVRPRQGLDYVAVDVSEAMLRRTREAAHERGVGDQVTTRRADVTALPYADGHFDRVLSLTGLHCFGDPAAAVAEMARVLRPGGLLTGSAVLNGTGPRWWPMHVGGRLGGLLGPGVTGAQVEQLLAANGMVDVRLQVSGALGYFRGVRGAAEGIGNPRSGGGLPT